MHQQPDNDLDELTFVLVLECVHFQCPNEGRVNAFECHLLFYRFELFI